MGTKMIRVIGMNGQMNNILTCATTISRRHTTKVMFFFLEDSVDEWMAEEDPSYNESLVTMRQSRDTMNRLRSARGFFKGKIDGVLEESSGPSMQMGKGKGKTKGKGKGRSRPVVRSNSTTHTHTQPPTHPPTHPPTAAEGKGQKEARSTPREVHQAQRGPERPTQPTEATQLTINLPSYQVYIRHLNQEFFEVQAWVGFGFRLGFRFGF